MLCTVENVKASLDPTRIAYKSKVQSKEAYDNLSPLDRELFKRMADKGLVVELTEGMYAGTLLGLWYNASSDN